MILLSKLFYYLGVFIFITIGDITNIKYLAISSGDCFMLPNTHHLTISKKLSQMWLIKKPLGIPVKLSS